MVTVVVGAALGARIWARVDAARVFLRVGFSFFFFGFWLIFKMRTTIEKQIGRKSSNIKFDEGRS